MRGRPNGQRLVLAKHLPRHVVDLRDALYLVTPEFHANGIVGIGRENVQSVAAHAEGAARKLVVIAVVLDIDEIVNHVVTIHLLLLVHENGHAGVIHRAADAVYAADAGNHDAIATRQERRRSRMTKLLHLFVDGGILLDERVGRRNVSFRLIVVVVGDEVDNRVIRKEFLELACKLSGKRFVRRHDQGGLLNRLDGFRHGEGLARSRYAKQGLIPEASLYALCKLGDCLGLVARGLIRGYHLQWRVGKAHLGQLARHGHALDVRQMR